MDQMVKSQVEVETEFMTHLEGDFEGDKFWKGGLVNGNVPSQWRAAFILRFGCLPMPKPVRPRTPTRLPRFCTMPQPRFIGPYTDTLPWPENLTHPVNDARDQKMYNLYVLLKPIGFHHETGSGECYLPKLFAELRHEISFSKKNREKKNEWLPTLEKKNEWLPTLENKNECLPTLEKENEWLPSLRKLL